MTTEVLVSNEGNTITIHHDPFEFQVRVSIYGSQMLTDATLTKHEGKTIGQLNRQALHDKLDEFIDKACQ